MDEVRPIAQIVPRLGRFIRYTYALMDAFGGPDRDRSDMLRAFDEHNEAVKRTVPPDRLLVFQMQDGWEPLCAFLDRDVPDSPFPHLNEGGDTVRARLRALAARPLRVALLVAGGLALAAVLVWRLG